MAEPTRVTYDDLPPEVLRVARDFIRGVFYNQEADRPYDEELLAKNVACHVLQAAAWTPDGSHRERLAEIADRIEAKNWGDREQRVVDAYHAAHRASDFHSDAIAAVIREALLVADESEKR